MIYGTPILKVETDVTDRIGIRTLVLGLMWQPSLSYLTQQQIDDETPDAPAVSTGMLLIGQQTRPVEGCYRTSWTYEGIWGDGKSVTFATRGNSFDYDFEPGFSQLEIQKHPYFQQLLTQYGGTADVESGRVIWPMFQPTGNTGPIGLGGKNSSAAPQVNPMFDFQDYMSLDGTYTYRYAALSIPTDLYAQIGLIKQTSELPGGPPTNLPDNRNWLKLPPVYKRRGLIFDITEHYWLSGRGGWPIPIYTLPGNSGQWPATLPNTGTTPQTGSLYGGAIAASAENEGTGGLIGAGL